MLSEMIFYFHRGREDRKHDELKNITSKKNQWTFIEENDDQSH